MKIREAEYQDLSQILNIYTYLHDNYMPQINSEAKEIWDNITKDPTHHIIVGVEDGEIIASCILIIIPNLTHNQRPYALIENVITNPEFRNKGYATQILDYAKEIAVEQRCYKIMLMTGSKKESTLNFYKKAGYNMNDKTAFIQWLK